MRTLSQSWQKWVVATLAATWLAAQNVGIGTTTPITRLHVAAGDIFLGEATGANGFVLHSRAGAGYDFLQISTRTAGTYEWSKGITLVRSSGNVGIGTTTPINLLHVADDIFLGDAAGTNGFILHCRAWAGYDALRISPRTGGSYEWSKGITLVRSSGNIGLGTAWPHDAALLHLEAPDKGFLPTQVALTSATSWSPLIGTPVNGMLVYNTATAGSGQNAVSPGYYYWRDGRWRRFTENAYAGMIQGVLHPAAQSLTTNDPGWQYLNSYIDLPPGKWVVYSVQLLRPSSISPSGSIWVRTILSDSPSPCAITPDHVGAFGISGLLPNSAEYGLVVGQIIINNTSGTMKRYYYCGHKRPYGGYNADLLNFATTLQGENQLYALPAE
jgi:hypothetical protein